MFKHSYFPGELVEQHLQCKEFPFELCSRNWNDEHREGCRNTQPLEGHLNIWPFTEAFTRTTLLWEWIMWWSYGIRQRYIRWTGWSYYVVLYYLKEACVCEGNVNKLLEEFESFLRSCDKLKRMCHHFFERTKQCFEFGLLEYDIICI